MGLSLDASYQGVHTKHASLIFKASEKSNPSGCADLTGSERGVVIVQYSPQMLDVNPIWASGLVTDAHITGPAGRENRSLLVKHTKGHIYYGLIGFSLVVLGAVLLWQVLQHRFNPFSLNQVKEFEGRTAWFLVAHLPFLNRGQTDIQHGSEDSLADMSLFAQ